MAVSCSFALRDLGRRHFVESEYARQQRVGSLHPRLVTTCGQRLGFYGAAVPIDVEKSAALKEPPDSRLTSCNLPLLFVFPSVVALSPTQYPTVTLYAYTQSARALSFRDPPEASEVRRARSRWSSVNRSWVPAPVLFVSKFPGAVDRVEGPRSDADDLICAFPSSSSSPPSSPSHRPRFATDKL
jgi:hypothetical protein